MALLYVRTPVDGLLAAVAPLGLAASAGTALMVDVDANGPSYPGQSSLARLLEAGARGSDLVPQQSGLAVLRSGGACLADAVQLLEALEEGWPAVVVRLPAHQEDPPLRRVVSVVPILPGALEVAVAPRSVLQRTGLAPVPSGGHVVLPRPSGRLFGDLLRGVVRPRHRWVRSWRPVWGWRW